MDVRKARSIKCQNSLWPCCSWDGRGHSMWVELRCDWVPRKPCRRSRSNFPPRSVGTAPCHHAHSHIRQPKTVSCDKQLVCIFSVKQCNIHLTKFHRQYLSEKYGTVAFSILRRNHNCNCMLYFFLIMYFMFWWCGHVWWSFKVYSEYDVDLHKQSMTSLERSKGTFRQKNTKTPSSRRKKDLVK